MQSPGLRRRSDHRDRRYRRVKRALAIQRALSRGVVAPRVSLPTVCWALRSREGVPQHPVLVRRRMDRAVGAVFLPRVVHRATCPASSLLERWRPAEFSSVEAMRDVSIEPACECPLEQHWRLPPVRRGFFWEVIERIEHVHRALHPSHAANEQWQRKRKRSKAWLPEKDFALLWRRATKLVRARALGIDWSEHEIDDEELRSETRARKLPIDAGRYS